MELDTGRALVALHGSSASDVWVAGFFGELWHLDGRGFGRVLRWNGQTFVPMS